MSFDRQASLSESDLNKIHQATMELLSQGGLVFHCEEALELFKANGFKISGQKVFFTEADITKALETVPSRFCFTARNAEQSRWVGENDFVFVPTYGPPFMVEADGTQRLGTMADYEKAVKLNHSSDVADIMGFKYVAPSDIQSPDVYLDMLKMSLTMSDKPFMGSTDDPQAAQDTMDLLKLVFGRDISDRHLTIGLINPLSPLAFAEEMSKAIMIYARHRQPVIILNMILAGSSGPIRLPGLLALINAEVLGGLVLSQLAGPGSPVIYGTTSCPIFMKTGTATVGNPETLQISSAIMQLARFYKLPCRTGGSLTDSLLPDGQAMAEGTLSMVNAVRGGANLLLHSFGMIGGYIGLSLEKWIMDEEICRYVKMLTKPMEINETTLDVAGIMKVGTGGSYLTRPETMKLCRTAFLQPKVFNKGDEAAWRKSGGHDLLTRVKNEITKRCDEFQAPDMAPEMLKDIDAFIQKQRRS